MGWFRKHLAAVLFTMLILIHINSLAFPFFPVAVFKPGFRQFCVTAVKSEGNWNCQSNSQEWVISTMRSQSPNI